MTPSTLARLARMRRWLATVLPSACLLCSAGGVDGSGLCPGCLGELPRNARSCFRCAIPLPVDGTCGRCQKSPPPVASTVALVRYAWPADELATRLKFRADLAVQGLMRALVRDERPGRLAGLGGDTLLVPVPLSRPRLAARGFNQAQVLAEAVAIETGAPLVHALERRRDTPAQVGLSRVARRRNVRDAFVADPARITGRTVWLVDDVLTTGATMRAAALALKRAGAGSVSALAFARALGPGPEA